MGPLLGRQPAFLRPLLVGGVIRDERLRTPSFRRIQMISFLTSYTAVPPCAAMLLCAQTSAPGAATRTDSNTIHRTTDSRAKNDVVNAVRACIGSRRARRKAAVLTARSDRERPNGKPGHLTGDRARV